MTVGDDENENQALNSVKGERSFTRKYAEGDDVRNIHWKLSSKQEDYMVWQNAENLSSRAAVLCDLTARRKRKGKSLVCRRGSGSGAFGVFVQS